MLGTVSSSLPLHALVALFVAVGCGDNITGSTNTPPQVAALQLTTAEDMAVSGMLVVSDAEQDDVTITLGTPTRGAVMVSGTTVTYTPGADYSGTDTVPVTVSDGLEEATANITITITAVNDAPNGVADSFATAEDVPLDLELSAVLANDTDIDGDALTVSQVGSPTNGTVALVSGDIVFTPTANFNGSASFQYTVSDSTLTDTVTVTVAVGGLNDPPVAVDDARTIAEDTMLTVTSASLVANDTDADGQTLTLTAVGTATGGTVALNTTTGMVTFTPTANFSGTATFSYTVTDGAATDTGLVTVTVTAVNDAPTAVDDTTTTAEDTAVTVTAATLLANDTDVDGPALTVTAANNPTNGVVSIDANGAVTFTPTANLSGTGGFDYTVSDGAGGTDVGRVTVTIAGVNDGPSAGPDAATTAEDTAVALATATLLANDSDGDGDPLTITSVTAGTGGTPTLAGTTVTFTPTLNFSGTATFTYTVSDGNGGTATGTVTVTVTPVNDAPIATDDAITTDEDMPVTRTSAQLTANDTDVEGEGLTITAVGSPVNGTVALTGGGVTFTPTTDFSGTASYEYTVSDSSSGTDTALVTVTVAAVNDAPFAVDDTATTAEDSDLVIVASSLVTNDTDTENDALAVTGVGAAVNGTVALAGGTITFTPTPNFAGAASFEYTLSDGSTTDTGRVAVTVTAVNDPPVAVDDTGAADAGVATQYPTSQFLANDTDADGGPLTITAVGAASNGTVSLAGTTITYQSDPAPFEGAVTFEYTVSDGTATDTGQVTITVVASNVCGDGAVLGSEQCDDGNTVDGDGCTATCTTEMGYACNGQPSVCATVCGDGLVAGSETCDDDETTVGDGCNAACETETGFTCVGQPSACSPTCGDGIIAGGETCDDAGTTGADGCSASCTIEAGYACSGAPSVCTTTCGDGVLAASEGCDDGDTDAGDGCSATCIVESGFACAGTPSVCTTTCGDGIPAGAETCDDGGTAAGDGCSTACTVEFGYACSGAPSVCATVCGDSVLTLDEQCDDGNTVDTDGCTSECVEGAVCTAAAHPDGDRFAVDAVTGHCYVSFDTEQTTFAAAQAACVTAGGYLVTITSAEESTLLGEVQNPAQNPWIGASEDGSDTDDEFVWVTGEPFVFKKFAMGQPDDDFNFGGQGDCLHLVNAAGEWNDTNCDIATFVVGRICELEPPVCGDNAVNAGEQCDDGNAANGDGCSATCQFEGCGDAVVVAPETCDDGNRTAGDGCSATCTFEGCGDGTVGAGEQCDDSNRTAGDGCSATCQFEGCGDAVVVAPETCDDGNRTPGDGCSATCTFETVVAFSFTGALGSEAMFAADSTDPRLASTPMMSRGAGVTGSAGANAFSSTNWTTSSSADVTDYFAFTITPASGFSMQLLALELDERRSLTGIRSWTIRSSLDGFVTDLQVFAVPDTDATRTDQRVLLGAAFANLSAAVEFRIYAYSSEAPGGTWRIDNVQLSGAIRAN